MRTRSLADSVWLTTGDVARLVERTPRGVRWLADEHGIASERMRSGQRLFRKDEILRLVDQRARARLAGVTRLRPRRIGVRGEPRQLALFSPSMRLVKRRESEASLPHAEVHRA